MGVSMCWIDRDRKKKGKTEGNYIDASQHNSFRLTVRKIIYSSVG
jgi:hypothetical protein